MVFRSSLILVALLFALLSSGCADTTARHQAYAPEIERPYLLDSGDRLRINVYGQETLTNSYAVDGGGNLSMPLIGTVQARGRTPRQLEQQIVRQLANGYLRDPSVTVEVETYRPFFILGEVKNPGQYPYVNGMTVETAVAIAGGYSQRASTSSVRLSHLEGGETVHTRALPTDPVRPGDTINVRERFF